MSNFFENTLIVSDLDGTLLNKNMTICACDLEAIKLFCLMGGKFTFATGRSIEAVRPYVDQLNINTPVILYNGALIYDFQKDEAVYEKFLPEQAKKAIKHLTEAFPNIGSEVMADNYNVYITNATEYTYVHTEEEKLDFIIKDFEHINNRLFKALFTCDYSTQKLLIKEAAQVSQDGFYFVPTSDHYYELVSSNTSKGTALAILSTKLSVPLKNTIGIGDYYNDIELLETAGYAVAMANAPEEVKSVANEIALPVENGGLGLYLYELIKKHQQ